MPSHLLFALEHMQVRPSFHALEGNPAFQAHSYGKISSKGVRWIKKLLKSAFQSTDMALEFMRRFLSTDIILLSVKRCSVLLFVVYILTRKGETVPH